MVVLTVVVLLLELYLGKTPKTKAGSILELLYNISTKRFVPNLKEISMEVKIAEGAHLSLDKGKVAITVDVGMIVNPKLEEIKVKIQSGEIDLIKGTDLDKMLLMQVVDALQKELNK